MNIDIHSLRSPYPISLALDGSQSAVHWLEFEGADLREPFFQSSIERLLRERPQVKPLTTNVNGLRALAKLPSASPSGFIFHTSRCGSTLLANALRSVESSVVVSEPQPLNALIAPVSHRVWPPDEKNVPALRDDLLVAVIGKFAQLGDTGTFIKCNSLTALLLPVIRRIYPQVPIIFIYRDPLEVVQANVTTPPGWVRHRQDPDTASQLFGWPPESLPRMGIEEYFARVFAAVSATALANRGENVHIIGYDDIRLASIEKIFTLLGAPLDHLDRGALAKAFSINAKDPAQRSPFDSDVNRKRSQASAAVREAVKAFAAGPYAELEKARTRFA